MIKVKPFRGILYNGEKVSDMAEVVSPPYDVISERELRRYYERHPNNVVRLDGSMPFGGNGHGDRYDKAAGYFRQWLSEDVLVEEDQPCFYVSAVEFEHEGKKVVRHGLISLVELEDYESGDIMPHEKTFSRTKKDRFELMKATKANFSQIFALFGDDGKILAAIKKLAKGKPEIKFKDEDGHVHKLWRIKDAAAQQQLAEMLAYKKLVIADGHHRYESALQYRDWVKENDPAYGPEHPANFVMTYLCSVKDKGLVILPTHRVLSKVDKARREQMFKEAEDFFYITPITFKEQDFDLAKSEFLSTLTSNSSDCTIGVLIKDLNEFYLFTLKPNIIKLRFAEKIPDPLRELDAAVLTRLIFLDLLDLDRSDLNDEGLISYPHSEDEAIEAVFSKRADMAFILNPPTSEEVINVAESGHTMPRKSTFYYPKVVTGQVMNSLDPERPGA